MLEKQLLLSVRYCPLVFVLSKSVRWIRVNTLRTRRPRIDWNKLFHAQVFPGALFPEIDVPALWRPRAHPDINIQPGLAPKIEKGLASIHRCTLPGQTGQDATLPHTSVNVRQSTYNDLCHCIIGRRRPGGDGMVTDVCGTCSECFGPFVTHLFPFFFLAELDRPLSVSRFSSSKDGNFQFRYIASVHWWAFRAMFYVWLVSSELTLYSIFRGRPNQNRENTAVVAQFLWKCREGFPERWRLWRQRLRVSNKIHLNAHLVFLKKSNPNLASGIGKATVERFVAEGAAKVVAADIQDEKLKELEGLNGCLITKQMVANQNYCSRLFFT